MTKGKPYSKWNGCWTHIQFFHKVLLNIVAHYCISNSTSSQSFWQNVIEINHLTSAHTNSLLKKVIIKEQHRGTLSETHNNCTRVKIVSVTQFHEIFVKNVEDQFEIEMILWKNNWNTSFKRTRRPWNHKYGDDGKIVGIWPFDRKWGKAIKNFFYSFLKRLFDCPKKFHITPQSKKKAVEKVVVTQTILKET